MAIKIQTQKTGIPIEFGELEFEFDTSDDNIQKFYIESDAVAEELKAVELVEGEEIQSLKEVLKKGYNSFLGEGAFDKIYKQTPSVIQLGGHLLDLSESIASEIESLGLTESQQSKVDKYLQQKKK